MIGLLAKELRQLLPIAYLWLAVLVLGYVIQFATERVDEETFGSWCEGYCDYSSNMAVAVFSVLLALVTAYSLFPREHDDATIDFLRALPVSRRSIFVAKVLAAWIILSAVNVLAYLIDAALLATNPESIGGRFYTQVWWTLLWRDCLFAFIILSHGILLSWFRTLGLVIYGIYLLGLMWAESYLGTSGGWSIFSLLSNQYHGSTLLVNGRDLVIHTVVALIMLLFAYVMWSKTDSSASGGSRKSRGTTVLQIALSVIGFLVVALVLSYQVGIGTGTANDTSLKVVSTKHYRFVYDELDSDVVTYIVENAEQDLTVLGNFLGVESLPNIRVDLTASSEHAAGLAKWKKIQMDLDAFEDDVSQRRVLSHETAHVLQAVESDRALAENYAAVKFFIEGMAQYTSFAVVPEIGRRQSNWDLAAVSWKRQHIEFTDLIDATGFSQRFDAELHYSLGDLWTKAMVNSCGEASLGAFIRATGRDGAQRDLLAGLFWRDTTLAIGCDLDTINVAWRKQMQALYEQVDKQTFPEYTDITVEHDDATGQIRIQASLKPAEDAAGSSPVVLPQRYIVRIGVIANQLAAGVDPVYRGQLRGEPGSRLIEFLVPDSAVSGSRFRYQLGFTPSADSRYYYESWRRALRPSGSDHRK